MCGGTHFAKYFTCRLLTFVEHRITHIRANRRGEETNNCSQTITYSNQTLAMKSIARNWRSYNISKQGEENIEQFTHHTRNDCIYYTTFHNGLHPFLFGGDNLNRPIEPRNYYFFTISKQKNNFIYENQFDSLKRLFSKYFLTFAYCR